MKKLFPFGVAFCLGLILGMVFIVWRFDDCRRARLATAAKNHCESCIDVAKDAAEACRDAAGQSP